MEDQRRGSGGGGGRLDAGGQREVVFCHQCENEWHRDEQGLVCPRCEGEITEIITPESDPRPEALQRPPTPPGSTALRGHNPWVNRDDDSDPEEADIEEHITHSRNGITFTQTVRRSPLQQGSGRGGEGLEDESPDLVMRDFQSMLNNLMGPQLRHGQPGRSGQDNLFSSPYPPNLHRGAFQMGGEDGGPRVVGGRFTFTTGGPGGAGVGPRVGPQAGGIASVFDNIFGQMGPMGQMGGDAAHGGQPQGFGGLPGLLAALMNPENARSGDAVYTQEALDRIISQLMEQHPTSNAPGPASPFSIASLSKIALTETHLGPEGKGECSVCMDDVHIGDEVVHLPCSHWFHEQCASAWLSEHNTCPICRKGIEAESTPPQNSGGGRRASSSQTQSNQPTSRNEFRARRLSTTRPRLNRDHTSTFTNRNARSDAIRSVGDRSTSDDASSSRNQSQSQSQDHDENQDAEQGTYQWRIVGGGTFSPNEIPPGLPGSFASQRSDFRTQAQMWRQRSRESRRSSQAGSSSGGNGNGGGGGGAFSWLRDRFSGGRRHD